MLSYCERPTGAKQTLCLQCKTDCFVVANAPRNDDLEGAKNYNIIFFHGCWCNKSYVHKDAEDIQPKDLDYSRVSMLAQINPDGQ